MELTSNRVKTLHLCAREKKMKVFTVVLFFWFFGFWTNLTTRCLLLTVYNGQIKPDR